MSNNPADYIQIAGPLFERVQKEGIFPDSKHFVDMIPKADPVQIMAEYHEKIDLKAFVEKNFFLPEQKLPEAPKCDNMHEYLIEMWRYLSREMTSEEKWSTLIDLPHRHIVPGGRFRECYYWDSYFVAKALGKGGHHLVENCAHLIDHYGFVPNGNRLYYLSRSQPPLFAVMSDLVEKDFSPQLSQEYHFWMRGVELGQKVHQHVVKTDIGILNRYFDPAEVPRPESYREDLPYAGKYGDIRAACESGWDFSSRWLADPQDFNSIETSKILPIDLNCLLYYLET
ncbi:MAG: trehalase family glycosidase, partial [Simkaniaceae bacterium]|nr:trehalase family glycosidase [Simkaniaceae bacterium]